MLFERRLELFSGSSSIVSDDSDEKMPVLGAGPPRTAFPEGIGLHLPRLFAVEVQMIRSFVQ